LAISQVGSSSNLRQDQIFGRHFYNFSLDFCGCSPLAIAPFRS
jgi:hypothetical protein